LIERLEEARHNLGGAVPVLTIDYEPVTLHVDEEACFIGDVVPRPKQD
jgi:hypothetical protein